jgi:hypothetical protein
MKRLTLFLTILSTLFFGKLSAQDAPKIPFDTITKKITYQEVIKIEGSKQVLYNRALDWINATYKNAVEVTRKRDLENGIIEGMHRFRLEFIDKDGVSKKISTVEYTFVLEFKDNRFRYTFTEFTLKEVSKFALERWLNKKDQAYTPLWDQYLAQVDKNIRELIEKLKTSMQPKVTKKDEW